MDNYSMNDIFYGFLYIIVALIVIYIIYCIYYKLKAKNDIPNKSSNQFYNLNGLIPLNNYTDDANCDNGNFKNYDKAIQLGLEKEENTNYQRRVSNLIDKATSDKCYDTNYNF
jgi:hypothetical protein